MPTLELPKILKSATLIEDETITVAGKTVLEAIKNACQKHSNLAAHVFYQNGELKNQFLISVDGNQAEPDTKVDNNDKIELMIATSGGAPNHDLSVQEVKRYSRHLTLPEVGVKGQMTLRQSKVLIVGLGGLGAPVAMYLAAMGIGTLGLIEFDDVEYSNLQRQIIHGVNDIGKLKINSAVETLSNINELITLVKHEARLDITNAEEIISQYDVIVDGTDNFSTRYLINDVSVLHNKPYIFASILGFEGQTSVLNHKGSPCYRCIFPEPPAGDLAPNCAINGVLGVLPGLMGTLQATEVVKLLLNIGEGLEGTLLIYDALAMTFKKLKLKRNPSCLVCSEKSLLTNLQAIEENCTLEFDEESKKNTKDSPMIDALTLQSVLNNGTVQLIDVREYSEAQICIIENAHNIPLRELPHRLRQLDRKTSYVVYCKTGARSAQAAILMQEKGFSNVRSLSGGILQWSKEVDNSVMTY